MLCELYCVPSSYVRGDTHDTAFRLGAESVVKMLMELAQEETDG